MNNLNLCKDHKQEWKQSEYGKENCDYCKLLTENKQLREYITSFAKSWQNFCNNNSNSKGFEDTRACYTMGKVAKEIEHG